MCGGDVVSSLMAGKTLMTMSGRGGLAPRSHQTTGRILQQRHLQTSGAMGQMPELGWLLCGKIVKGT
jgi:hypothetical protein